MEKTDQRFWPFGTRVTLLSVPSLLLGLLFAAAILRKLAGWPGAELDRIVVIGILVISLLPLLLKFVDTVVERKAIIEYRGVKLDFSRMSAAVTSSVAVPQNIGVPGQPVTDSDTERILDALRQAVANEVVLVDLEDGHAWWETRLLVLIAGAVRLGRPCAMVFQATEGGVRGCFQGWADPSELLPQLLRADRRYQESYARVAAAARQWELIEPLPQPFHPPGPPSLPPLPPGMQGVALSYFWMVFDGATGMPNRHAPEQALAAELGRAVEVAQPPAGITIVRLQALFQPVLHTKVVDEGWPSAKQREALLAGDAAFIAVTREKRYLRLLPRLEALTTIVSGLVGGRPGD